MSFLSDARTCLGMGAANDQNLPYLEERINRLIPFVGAGLSVDFNYPTWSGLLRQIAARHDLDDEVEPFIASREFEEAAELIEHRAPGVLVDSLREMLDPTRIETSIVERAAVRHLPRLTTGLVVTTNFDRVLEVVFEHAGKPFTDVYPGSKIVLASRAVHDNRHALLKLHGTYDTDEGRVLTLTEYRTQYASDRDEIDRTKPLPSVLGQALGAYPMLFIGCSLENDRTTRVIADLIERLPGLTHFAVLPESENTVKRRAELRRWNIYPLFFCDKEFDRIGSFLKLLADYSEHRTRHARRAAWQRFVLPVLAVVLLLLAAVWAFRPESLDDRLRRLQTQEAGRAAESAFKSNAKAAGYEDAQILSSWFGNFLIEEWLPRQMLVEALSQKREADKAGDLGIGIWHDTPRETSVWSVSAGLSSPGVRPVVSGPTFTINSRGIEPAVGPHRESAGGASAVGAAVVLGVYAGSYPTPLGEWICRNFRPRAAPFIDLLPSIASLQSVTLSAPDGCPQLLFQSVKDGLQTTSTARFRTRMNLRPVSAEQPPDDTVYVSVAKVVNSAPLPVRVSLLWLTPSPSETARREPRRLQSSGAPDRFRKDALGLPNEPLLGFVEIPAGEFLMGSNKSRDPQAENDELPQHKVTLPSYFMGRYEVTVAQFKAFLDATTNTAHPNALAGPDDSPVQYVSWSSALAYATWLDGELHGDRQHMSRLKAILTSEVQKCVVTLPSEAEWEKAARGSDGRIYPWGDGIDPSKANYLTGQKESAMPVGSYHEGASPYGLFDMSGNVWEWTRSLLESRPGLPEFHFPYRPDDLDREKLSADSGYRIVRGGSYANPPFQARAAFRLGAARDSTPRATGFRVAISCASH
jgi:formylglycine-generating enzyme required for sulfatase activity